MLVCGCGLNEIYVRFDVVKIGLVCQSHRIIIRYRFVIVNCADGVIDRETTSKMLDDVVHRMSCNESLARDQHDHLMEFCGCVDCHNISLVQEVFEQDERAKVCRSANDNEDDC